MKTEEYLNSPMSIQSNVLRDIEGRLAGDVSIVDANNSFMLLMESFSRIVSEATQSIDGKLDKLYAKRARTISDLYPHISDYEYVGMFSSPAPMKVVVTMSKEFILNEAVSVPGTTYSQIIIPKDTTVRFGKYNFAWHYPISIRVANIINNITVAYSTEEDNPIHELETNVIPARDITYGGIDLIAFEVDMYQFERTTHSEIFETNYGFTKDYKFTDAFYAAVIRGKNTVGNTVELRQTLADNTYDPNIPTALLKIYQDTKTLNISVPQLYFTNNSLVGDMKVTLYSTIGAMDVHIGNLSTNDILVNFGLESNNTDLTYSNMLINIPTFAIIPTEPRIVGGNDHLPFEDIKSRVVYNTDKFRVPVTNMEIVKYYERYGFDVSKRIDNLTDRVYYAFKTIEHNDLLMDVINTKITINPDDLGTSYSTIRTFVDGRIVLLPSTVFKHDEHGHTRLVPDIEITALLNDNNVISRLNSEMYINQPYHICIDTGSDIQTTTMYDLLNVTADSVEFREENINIDAQIDILYTSIHHRSNNVYDVRGDAGYKIIVGISKGERLKDIPESDFTLYMTFTNISNSRLGVTGTYLSTLDDVDMYEFGIETDYHLLRDQIYLTNLENHQGSTIPTIVALSSTVNISAHVKRVHFPEVSTNPNIDGYFVTADGSTLSIALYSFQCTLGRSLEDVVDDAFLTQWSNTTYATHPVDIMDVYEHDVYETHPAGGPTDPPEGTLVYTIVGGNVVLNKLHSAGEIKLDVNNNPIVKYPAGSIMHDASGTPIELQGRALLFTTDFFGFNFKYTYNDADFLTDISSSVSSYFGTISTLNANILEKTRCYFRPITTMGTIAVRVDGSSTRLINPSLEFSIRCNVPQRTYISDTIRTMLTTEIHNIFIAAMDNDIVSTVDICNDIASRFDDYIHSVDTLGINGDIDMQTIQNMESDKKMILRHNLVRNDDGSTELVHGVIITFVSMEVQT